MLSCRIAGLNFSSCDQSMLQGGQHQDLQLQVLVSSVLVKYLLLLCSQHAACACQHAQSHQSCPRIGSWVAQQLNCIHRLLPGLFTCAIHITCSSCVAEVSAGNPICSSEMRIWFAAAQPGWKPSDVWSLPSGMQFGTQIRAVF